MTGWSVVPFSQVKEWEQGGEYVVRMVHDRGYWATVIVLCGEFDVLGNGELTRKIEVLTMLDGGEGIVNGFDKARRGE